MTELVSFEGPTTVVPIRPLNDWYQRINETYFDRNFYRDTSSVFAHLVEVMGGLSALASGKHKSGITPQGYVPKALAWWLALCGRMGVASVEQMLWWKFPAVCPYCMRNPHDPRTCKTTTGAKELDWAQLERVGRENRRQQPQSLKAWHEMFVNIYQPNFQSSGFERVFARFTEELGELAEAVRVFPVAPGYFLSEAADVFAWLMHLQELLVQSKTVSIDLDKAFFGAYPDRCLDCKGQVCKCPPILRTTLGRIAHEAPTGHSSFAEGGALLTVDKAMSLFGPGGQTITLFGEEFDLSILRELRGGLEELLTASLKLQNESVEHRRALIDALDQLRDQVMAQRLTDEDIDAVAQAIAALPPTGKNTLINFLTGVSSGAWAAIFVQAIERIHN